jgi:hypothetical protein
MLRRSTLGSLTSSIRKLPPLIAVTVSSSTFQSCRYHSSQKDLLRSLVADRSQAVATLPPEEIERLLNCWDKRVQQNTKDPLTVVLLFLSAVNMLFVYLIIFDWLYQGHVDLWDGTYGLDDEDDDDEDD